MAGKQHNGQPIKEIDLVDGCQLVSTFISSGIAPLVLVGADYGADGNPVIHVIGVEDFVTASQVAAVLRVALQTVERRGIEHINSGEDLRSLMGRHAQRN